MVIRWAGRHQAGHGQEPDVRGPRLGADAGGHRRRAQGRRVEEADRGGQVPRASSRPRSTASTSATSWRARPTSRRAITFFYYSGAHPSAVRYKNWKMYFTMSQPGPAGWLHARCVPFHFTLVQNIKRDPFETGGRHRPEGGLEPGRRARRAGDRLSCTTGTCCPSASSCGWRSSMSYKKYPPLQAPASPTTSSRILEQLKKHRSSRKRVAT